MDKHGFSLKKIQTIRTFDGGGYSADLYLNGNLVAMVVDDGNGGGMYYHATGLSADVRKINDDAIKAAVEAIPPEAMPEDAEDWMKDLYPDGFRKLTLEDVVAQIIDEWEDEKRKKRLRVKNVLYRTPDQPKGQFWKQPHGGNLEAMKAKVLAKYPLAVFL